MSRSARKAALTQEEASLCSEAALLQKELEVGPVQHLLCDYLTPVQSAEAFCSIQYPQYSWNNCPEGMRRL